jgi:hypothetical protein
MKKGIILRKVVAIAICLVVTTMFLGCGDGDDNGGGNNGGGNNGGGGITNNWPSAAVLAKYGLDGMTKPTGYSDGYFYEVNIEEGGQLSISFSGNASTATDVKKYFSDSSSWEKVQEVNLNEVFYTYYSKESNGINYTTYFAESNEGKSFQLVAVRGIIEE